MFNLVHRSTNDFPHLFWQQVVCCEGASKYFFRRKAHNSFSIFDSNLDSKSLQMTYLTEKTIGLDRLPYSGTPILHCINDDTYLLP